MKKSIAVVMAAACGVVAAVAHEPGEHASTAGIFGLKAEYVHVLINPLPVYGLALGAVALIAAWLARSRSAQVIALLLIVFSSAMAWPVLYFGQHGYNHLYPQLDTESQQWLATHMNRAEGFIYIFYTTAILGAAALASFKKFPKAARALSIVTLLASFISVGIGGWISRAGGEASHSEFREGEPPTNSMPADEHVHGQQQKEKDTK